MEKKEPTINANNKNNNNKKFILISILLTILVLGVFYLTNKSIMKEEIRHPLRRRNAMTEKEIEEILRKMENNLK